MKIGGRNINPKGGIRSNGSRAFRSPQPTFSRPTSKCLYVRILNLLKDELLEEPTRRNIYKALGYSQRFSHELNQTYTDTSISNCVWAGMKWARLIKHYRVGRAVYYEITPQGKAFLDFYEL